MTSRDPWAAAAWVATLPAGPSQDHAYEHLFENWTRSDPLAASESLSALESGAARDSAIQAFSNTLSRENPEDALVWTGELSNSNQLGNLLASLA